MSSYSERLSASLTQGQCRKQSKKLSVYKNKKKEVILWKKGKKWIPCWAAKGGLRKKIMLKDTVEEFC